MSPGSTPSLCVRVCFSRTENSAAGARFADGIETIIANTVQSGLSRLQLALRSTVIRMWIIVRVGDEKC